MVGHCCLTHKAIRLELSNGFGSHNSDGINHANTKVVHSLIVICYFMARKHICKAWRKEGLEDNSHFRNSHM